MTNFKNSKYFLLVSITICLSLILSSCRKEEEEPPSVTTKEIAQEIKDLIYYQGNENASTVLINAQGGPDIELSTGEVDFIAENFTETDLLVVNTHQAQTLNPDIVLGDDISLDQAVDFNDESIATLAQVIEYFKAQNRTVYVLGASFGAFIVQELIAQKGIDIADKYLIMIGRLDMNDVMWQGLAEGRYGYFENGVTPVLDSLRAMDAIEINMGKIAAGLGKNKYTQQWNSVTDLSNLTYIYGATDEAVGSLTAEEVAFLESKNANIIKGSGGHDDTFNDFFIQGLKEAFGIE